MVLSQLIDCRSKIYGSTVGDIQCPSLWCPRVGPYFDWKENNLIKWPSWSNFTQSDTHRQEADSDEDPLIEEGDLCLVTGHALAANLTPQSAVDSIESVVISSM